MNMLNGSNVASDSDSLNGEAGPGKFSIPNLISIFRLVIVPVLLYAAWTHKANLFLVLFCILLVMSFADGFIARKLKQVTELGAELDSWGLFAAYLIVPIGAWMLWPELVQREASFVIAVVGFYFVPATLGLMKYGHLTSYHTWSSKLSAVLLSGTAIMLFMGGPSWPFRLATPFLVISGIEEIFMTAILPQWRANIPSLWHAIVIERTKVEDALRESEKKYRTILANIEDGYFEVDLAGNLTFFNPTLCKYLGYSEIELRGMNNRQIMSEVQAKIAYETFNQVYRTGKTLFARDWEFIRKDGARRFFEASITLMRDPKGEPIGFRCFGRDTTERKHAEEQAQFHQEQLFQAGKMVALGTLVSGVAHDINNPNNFIRLNTPLLKEAWESALPVLEEYYKENGDFSIGGMNFTEMREKVPKLFAGILDGSQRIQQIVDDLKNFVRKGTPDMTDQVDMNAVLKSAISLTSNMIHKSTNRFSFNYEKNLPMLTGNFHRLEQVIINLIQNACQALPNSQKGISASTSYDEDKRHIVINVEDEGTGIPNDSLPYITDTFFTTKYDSGGVGLGLSISSKIIEEHGGKMAFTSEVDKGTKVKVTLPVAPAKKVVKEAIL
jgi:PAS domain S-box-containing protein